MPHPPESDGRRQSRQSGHRIEVAPPGAFLARRERTLTFLPLPAHGRVGPDHAQPSDASPRSSKTMSGHLSHLRNGLVASLLLVTMAAAASAQSITDPRRIEFTPSGAPGALDVRTGTPL